MHPGRCQNCGQEGMTIAGYCGDCAPASAVDEYVAWWNSPDGKLHRQVIAEEVISELALEVAENGESHPDKSTGGPAL